MRVERLRLVPMPPSRPPGRGVHNHHQSRHLSPLSYIPAHPWHPPSPDRRSAPARRSRPSCSCARPPPRTRAAAAGAPPPRSPRRPVLFGVGHDISLDGSMDDQSIKGSPRFSTIYSKPSIDTPPKTQSQTSAPPPRTEMPTATRGRRRRAVPPCILCPATMYLPGPWLLTLPCFYSNLLHVPRFAVALDPGARAGRAGGGGRT